MKKIKYLLLIIVGFFGFITLTNAAGINTRAPINVVYENYYAGINHFNPDFKNPPATPKPYHMATVWNIYSTVIDGVKQPAYCIDAKGIAPTAKVESTRITREFSVDAKNSLATNVYNSGVKEIMAKGYNYSRTSYTAGKYTVSGYNYYIATNIAIRNYTNGIFNDTRKGSTWFTASIPASHVLQAAQWYKELPKADRDALHKYQKMDDVKKVSWYRPNAGFKVMDNTGAAIMAVAKELFMDGLKVAAQTARKELVIPTIAVATKDSAINSERDYNEIIRTITLTPRNFDKKGSLKSIRVTSSSNSTMSIVSTTYTVDGVSRANLNNVNLEKNPKIEIHLKVRATSRFCDPLEYTLQYEYTDGITDINVYVIEATQAFIQRQRLMVSDFTVGQPQTTKKTHKGSVDICLDACLTEITIPKACTELGEDANEEWVESTIRGPEDVIKCVVGGKIGNSWSNKVDDAGNTYKASSCKNTESESNEMNEVSNNPYCAVYCKEDYASIKFSGIKTVNSGRYFKIGAEITGTKTCYTSKIDSEQFTEDIIKVQEEMITALNDYRKYTAAVAAYKPYKITNSPQSGCCNNSERTAYKSTATYTGIAVASKNTATGVVTAKNVPNASYNRSSTGTGCSMICHNNVYDPQTGQCRSPLVCDNKYQDGTPFKQELEKARDAAKNDITRLRNKLDSMVNSYNSCSDTGGWDTVYDFNQKIGYDYDEDYMKMSTLRPQDKFLKPVKDSLTTESSEFKCNGELASNDEGRYEKCSTTSTARVTRKFLSCTTSGCSNTATKSLSQARYVKRAVTKQQAYETPRVFYNVVPSGNVVHESDSESPNYQTEVIDGLPVAIKTTVGQHNFKYDISDLGEFYNNCNLGRLIGAENSVVAALTEANEYEFIGEYVCHYMVNCPNCEFICTTPDGGDCEWDVPPVCTDKGCCPECIFTIDSLQFYFRTISNKDINPNNRPLGFNWNYKYNVNDVKYGFVAAKALETVSGKDGIDTIGEEVYAKDPILTVELTPSMANKIRKYNKTNESEGGYSNNSITCYDYTLDGKTYKNVFCYSDLLDDLQKDYSNNVKFIDSRLNTESLRKNNNTQNGYWNVYTKGMPVASEHNIGGPSWK